MKKKKLQNLKRYIFVVIGLLIVSFSFNLFMLKNELAAFGISGLALLFYDLYDIDISIFVLISNILLIALSYLVLDNLTTKRTIIGALLSPIFLSLTLPLAQLIDLSEVELIVQVIIAGVSSGIGYGLIFKQGYTSGGTDIINQLASFTYKIPLKTAIILVDGLIVVLGGLVFGIENMIYSIIILVLISTFSDKTLIGIGKNKNFYIYTSKPKEVKEYLLDIIKTDITIINAKGGYSSKNMKILMSIVNTNDYYRVKEGIKLIDDKSFIVISDTHELTNSNKRFKED